MEPDTYAFGSTIVSAFQVGRVSGGGSSNIGWARSGDGGATWTHGFLPGITTNGGGAFGQASDAAVAFDARHNVWLISSLGISGSTVNVLTQPVDRRRPYLDNPVTTATGANDKNWTACDNTGTSPYFGNCYTEYDTTSSGDSIRMRTSTNGGATWGAAPRPAAASRASAVSRSSCPTATHGAVSVAVCTIARSAAPTAEPPELDVWSRISHHTIRRPARGASACAEVDASGTVYVSWSDCRFRSGCPSNDIVLAKSTSETTWAGPTRVPIDPSAAPSTTSCPASAWTGHLGRDCADRADVPLLSDRLLHGGDLRAQGRVRLLDQRRQQVEQATPLAGPMNSPGSRTRPRAGWWGTTSPPPSRPGGHAYPILPIANAPTGSTFNLAMYVPNGGLAVTGGTHAATPARRAVATAPPVRPTVPPIPLTAH